jgi:hypothetical protein
MSRIVTVILYYIARYFYIVSYSAVTRSAFWDFFLYKIEGIGHKKRMQVTIDILRQKKAIKALWRSDQPSVCTNTPT